MILFRRIKQLLNMKGNELINYVYLKEEFESKKKNIFVGRRKMKETQNRV